MDAAAAGRTVGSNILRAFARAGTLSLPVITQLLHLDMEEPD